MTRLTLPPTTDDDAVVTRAGSGAVTLIGIESAVIDGQGGADALTYTSPAGPDMIEFTPGPGNDGSAGSIAAGTGLGGVLMPLSFTDVFGPAPNLTFADVGGNRTDILSVAGTANDDAFNLNSAGDIVARDSQGLLIMPRMATPGISQLTLQGHNGDDRFDVPGNHPFAALIVEGGNPGGGSDIIEFNGAGLAVTIDLGLKTIAESGFAAVDYSSIELVNVNAATANVTVLGTLGDDTTVVTPTAANAATLVNNAAAPTFNLSAVGTLLVDPLAGDDTLRVDYTSAAETIAVNVPAGMISDGTLESVTFANANTEAVQSVRRRRRRHVRRHLRSEYPDLHRWW